MKQHWIAFVAVGVLGLIPVIGCSPKHEFEAEDIHAVAQSAVGLPAEDAIAQIHQALKDQYPGKVRDDLQWHFNRTGGTLGQMAILYASLDEYVLIFGTPVGSEGFSGRYADMVVYDCMFAGEMWTYTEGQLAKTVYRPGDCAVLERGEGKGYLMMPDTWMLEYTRGNIPAALPIGVFAPVSVTADYQNMWSVFWDYAGLVVHSRYLRNRLFREWCGG